jgi:hypothetical protein
MAAMTGASLLQVSSQAHWHAQDLCQAMTTAVSDAAAQGSCASSLQALLVAQATLERSLAHGPGHGSQQHEVMLQTAQRRRKALEAAMAQLQVGTAFASFSLLPCRYA